MASTSIAVKPQQNRQRVSASDKAENVFLEQQQLEHNMRVQKLAMEMEFLKEEHQAKMLVFAKQLDKPLPECCNHADNL